VVELARELLDKAPAGGIAVSVGVWKEVQGFLQAVPVAAADSTGNGGTDGDTAFAITGVGRAYTRWQARAARSLGPFQGRQAERELLLRMLGEAGRRRGAIVGLIGEAGIGKSRLANEVADLARRLHGWTVLETGVSPRECEVIFAPLRPILREWLGADSDTPPADLPERAMSKLAHWGPAFAAYAPALVSLLDVVIPDPAWTTLGEAQRRQIAIDALVAVLARAGEDRPILLVIEDLHWLDPGTEQFLNSLAPILSSTRLLVVTTSRPDYRPPWSGRADYLQSRLAPLSEAEAFGLLDGLLGEDDSLADVKRQLIRDAGGNPFFLEESVRALIETGILTGAQGDYRAAGRISALPVAPTVQGVIAARIDRLTPDHRTVVEAASVIGPSFALGVLAAMLGWPKDMLRDILAELETAEFLRLIRFAPEREYSFKHALTQQVAYRGMLKSTLSRLHAAAGSAIEQAAGRRIGDFVEVLAEHFELGEIWEKASDYRAKAAERAKAQYGYEMAAETCA